VFLHLVPLLALAWLVASLLMLLLWMWHLRLHNAAVVDVGWAGGLALVALIDAGVGAGDPVRRWTAALLMAIWGGRLAVYLLTTRVFGHGEDARYAALRQARGRAANRWFFWFFQAQALLVALLSWPVAAAASDPNPTISPLMWIGAALWMAAVVGESVADRQLSAFKAVPANRGRTCRAGLWRYSRHPNYFFEWLVWVAYAIVATPSPGGWLAWFCPALMLYFLYRVTGIPATEAQALKSRGEEYRDYQRTTSAFVPWLPRRDRAHV
jgi:steroid 5-alpha reductase family enzyme